MRLGVKLLRTGAIVPEYKTRWSAGMDLCALLKEDVILRCNEPVIIPTGLAFEIANGYEVQIRPRSGLACKYGVTVVNSPGTIDSDYTGEIKVGLINLGNRAYKIKSGDRIAQAVYKSVEFANIDVITTLKKTERGAKGFGSTGK